MNAAGRKRLEGLVERLTAIKGELEEMAQDERDKFDNLPDSLQTSASGQAFETAAEALETAAEACDEVEAAVDEALE